MRESNLPYIGMIPESWKLVLLGQLSSEVNELNSECTETNALQFKMGSIISKSTGDSKYHPETLEGYKVVSPGDIIVNGLNLNYDLKSLRVGQVEEKGVITAAYIALRPKGVNPGFLKYLLKGLDFIKTFHGMGKGIRLTLSYSELKKMFIPVPSIEEQRRIAEFLDGKSAEIDTILEKTRASIEEYKKLKQAVITDAVTKGIRGVRPMKDSGVEWIGMIPANWIICRVKHVLVSGKDGIKIGPFGSSLTNKVSGEGAYKVYGQWNIVDKDFSAGKNFVSADTFHELSAYQVFPGDVLISMMGTIGKCATIPEGICEGIMDSHVIKARLNKKKIASRFFELIYDKDNSSFVFDQMQVKKKGSIMDGLNSTIVKNLILTLPPLSEQLEIAAFLDEKCAAIDSLIASKKALITELEAYRKSIIYEYVTGKKEV